MNVGEGSLGVKIFLILLFLYGTVSTIVWVWNKFRSKVKKDESR